MKSLSKEWKYPREQGILPFGLPDGLRWFHVNFLAESGEARKVTLTGRRWFYLSVAEKGRRRTQ